MCPPPTRFTRVNSTRDDPPAPPREQHCVMAPLACTIVVTGVLDPCFDETFEGLSLTEVDGNSHLSGPLIDQAQLQGVLRHLFDLGLEVVSFTSNPAIHPA
jgi:hypothetical protein